MLAGLWADERPPASSTCGWNGLGLVVVLGAWKCDDVVAFDCAVKGRMSEVAVVGLPVPGLAVLGRCCWNSMPRRRSISTMPLHSSALWSLNCTRRAYVFVSGKHATICQVDNNLSIVETVAEREQRVFADAEDGQLLDLGSDASLLRPLTRGEGSIHQVGDINALLDTLSVPGCPR